MKPGKEERSGEKACVRPCKVCEAGSRRLRQESAEAAQAHMQKGVQGRDQTSKRSTRRLMLAMHAVAAVASAGLTLSLCLRSWFSLACSPSCATVRARVYACVCLCQRIGKKKKKGDGIA